MFGRLNEEKRAKAVDLMDGMIHEIARIFMSWSTSRESFLTPTKPYIDELYVLSSMAIYSPYISWRKKRPDAHEDVILSVTNIYSDVFEKFRSDWPFKSIANDYGDFIGDIGDLMDTRFKEYEIALHHELVNIEAEKVKARHESGDGYSDILAASMADQPFKELVCRRLFDVDFNDIDESRDYSGFVFQVLPLMSKRGDVFIQYLKRL